MKATIEQIKARDGARAFRVAKVGAVDVEKRTVELAFSSEARVRRWYGTEILSHQPESVVMTRLADKAPLLLEHDTDRQIGVIESVSIDADRRGRAVVRFGRSTRAEEVFQDVQDGIRSHVSVGYIIHDARVIETGDDGDTWEIVSWEPFEISIVAVPADTSVGIGRSAEIVTEKQPVEVRVMNEKDKEAPAAENAGQKAADAERARVRTIMEMGKLYRADEELVRTAVADGSDVQAFQSVLLNHIVNRKQVPLSDQLKHAEIGLTEKEARNFSFVKAIRVLLEPSNRRFQEEAAFELEASRAAADLAGKQPTGVMVPADVLTRALSTAKTPGDSNGATGGYLVANDLLSSSFIDQLRNASTIMRLGTIMGGLVGNVDIPKKVSGVSGHWIGENEASQKSNLVFSQIPLSPKTASAHTEITRKLLKQNSLDVEALVRADIAEALGLMIDAAGYYGTGSANQPRGIASHTGVGALTLNAEQPTFAELVEMETKIGLANAVVSNMAYVGNAKFRGHCKTTLKFDKVPGTIWEGGGTVNDYRVEVTNQIQDKHVFLGNFADLIVAMWGNLELNVDPYSNSTNGSLKIIGFQDVDFGLRRVESFCHAKHS